MTTITVYISPDGKEFPALPSIYNNVSPIHRDNYEALGWTTRTVQIEEPMVPTISPELVAKEKAFVAALLQYAGTLNIDLSSIENINIANLKQAASDAGATDFQVAEMGSALMMLAFDIMAETTKPWAIAWAELKSRMPGYIEELL
jgi:hypothetical protein